MPARVILWMCPAHFFFSFFRRSNATCEIKNLERTSAVHYEGDVHRYRCCIELKLLRRDADERNDCFASSDDGWGGCPGPRQCCQNRPTSEEEGNTGVRPLPKRHRKAKKKVLVLEQLDKCFLLE
jgi:hypothetical protein